MKRQSARHRDITRWHKQHKVSLLLICTALIISGSFTGFTLYRGQQRIATIEQERIETSKHYDVLIKKLTDEREARELAAKKAAEEKARKEAAEKAALTTSESATQIMSAACNMSRSHNNPVNFDVIVNKRNCLMPLSYAPSDLVSSHGVLLRQEVAAQFSALVATARQAGITIGATSGYRSYSAQISTYQHWVAVNGSIAAADTVSARAGYSEHQTGLAVDVSSGGCALDCFVGTAAYAWMKENAYKYGFIERYPPGMTHITGYSPEAWHYRYVGVQAAEKMHTSGIRTLEQYANFPAAPDY